MYSASNGFKDAVKAQGRQIHTKADINGGEGNGGVTLYGDGTDGAIVGLTWEDVMSSGGLTIGGTASCSCKMTLRLPSTPLALAGGTFKPYVGLVVSGSIEWIPLGVFYVTDVSQTNSAVVEVTGYDGMYLLAKPYVPTISFPARKNDIFADITAQTGVQFKAVVDNPTFDVTYECSCREMVGWIVGKMGMNARFDRSGVVNYVWSFGSPVLTIDGDEQFMNGLTSATPFTIQSLTSGTEENPIVSGNGAGIVFPNPYITQTNLDNMLSGRSGMTYLPMTCSWRGNPCMDAGDVITVEVNGAMQTTFVTSHTLTIGGGMKDDLRADAPTDAEIHFETTPTQQKINQVYTVLQEALANATALINGAKGGIFEVVDSDGDGVNDGWIIKSSPDPNFAGQVIVANHEGIGFSTDGGATYGAAILTSGEIDGQYIKAGSISAEQIQVGDETLGSYVYVGHRRPNDNNTPIVMRIGSLTAGRVTEIMGDRTSIYDVGTYNNYINSSMTEATMNAASLFYYTETTMVMQKVDSIQLGTTTGSLLIQPLADGYGFMAVS